LYKLIIEINYMTIVVLISYRECYHSFYYNDKLFWIKPQF